MRVRAASPSELEPKPKRGRPATTADAPARRRYATPLAHPSYSIEPCPACGFPEADGGYCAECGWSLPHPFAQ